MFTFSFFPGLNHINNFKSNQATLEARPWLFLLSCGIVFKNCWYALSAIPHLIMIYYQTHLTFWLTDVKPQTARPLQNVNNLTLCSSDGDWTPPVIQQLNWSQHLLSDWWHSQNDSAFLHWPDGRVRVLVGVCLCGTVEVIISSGRRDFLVPVVVPRGAVPAGTPSWSVQTHPPSAVPWAQLICYSLLNFTQSISCFPLKRLCSDVPIFWHWRGEGKWRKVLWGCIA